MLILQYFQSIYTDILICFIRFQLRQITELLGFYRSVYRNFFVFHYCIYTKLKTVINGLNSNKTKIFYFATRYLYAIFLLRSRSLLLKHLLQYIFLLPVFSIKFPHLLQCLYFLWSRTP